MSRLTEKEIDYLIINGEYSEDADRLIRWAASELREYRKLEEQCRLIELPCAVGDKVYTIERHCPKPWKKEYCDDARKILREDSCSVCPHRTAYIATHEFDFDDLTYESEIFTTKEEAEAKLAETRGAE